jgi:uncharacterized protein (TIGR00255 family)
MTGHGRASFALGSAQLTIEASSVNRKGLEIFVSGPPEWASALERLATSWIREFASRGKISLLIQQQGTTSENTLFWDASALAQSLKCLRQQATDLAIPFSPNTSDLLQLVELHRSRRTALPLLENEAVCAALAAQVRIALSGLAEMRDREGTFLANDLRARLTILESLLDQIIAAAPGCVPRHRELLLARLRQAGLDLNLDDERILKEIALFADRCDISEEATRLRSHFGQFHACLVDGREVGRKLDFLCQEMNRELNTIGSKANLLQITHCVIEGKNELERIREQVQNVE